MILNLDTHLRLDDSVHEAANLCDRFSPEDLTRLGTYVAEGYAADEQSREAWLRRTTAAMDLAMQVVKMKTFPWPNAANVAFPLVTIAAMQFHSRAYPTLIDGVDVVKRRVPGYDAQGAFAAQADKVGRYMSYQVLEEDCSWEEEHDRLFLSYSIVGCEFIKTYLSGRVSRIVSERVAARDLVMNYYAKSVEDCPRKTQIVSLSRNEVHERCLGGVFRASLLEEGWYGRPYQPPLVLSQIPVDQRRGLLPPPADDATPVTFLEQHCWLDLDQDGYAEPYIVTVEMANRYVVRIVARWERRADIDRMPNGKVIRIRATEYFTKYGFIPSPDGSVYDVGWGLLLGPLNESVSTLINQLLDSGTFQTAAGGFFSRGVKIRGGATTFVPFGWQRVDSTGDDLRKGIFPYPKNEPSLVLFNLLSLLVSYAQRISSSTDMIAGENPGQNTPAETSRTMVEQGMKIFNALFKRAWRCMKEEFKKRYILNGHYMPAKVSFGMETIGREDFLGDPTQICPAADPNVTSETQRIQLALTISERARMVPGYAIPEVEKNLLRAMRIENVDTLYPGPEKLPPPAPDVKLQIAQLKGQQDAAELKQRQLEFVATMQETMRTNQAQIIMLEAQAKKFESDAASEQGWLQIEHLNAVISAAKAQDDSLRTQIEHQLKLIQIASDHHIELKKIEAKPAPAAS